MWNRRVFAIDHQHVRQLPFFQFNMEKHLNEVDIVQHVIPFENSIENTPGHIAFILEDASIKPLPELQAFPRQIAQHDDRSHLFIIPLLVDLPDLHLESFLLNLLHILREAPRPDILKDKHTKIIVFQGCRVFRESRCGLSVLEKLLEGFGSQSERFMRVFYVNELSNVQEKGLEESRIGQVDEIFVEKFFGKYIVAHLQLDYSFVLNHNEHFSFFFKHLHYPIGIQILSQSSLYDPIDPFQHIVFQSPFLPRNPQIILNRNLIVNNKDRDISIILARSKESRIFSTVMTVILNTVSGRQGGLDF